ncbi:MAG: ABC transporter permease [Rhizomicrobium sp.]|jgi:ABC-2 type transport system permease protein
MWAALLRIGALVRKELLGILKDPRSRYSFILPPILQCLIFGYAASYDLNDVPYAVLDQDHGAASRELLSRLDGTRVFHRTANLVRQADIATVINNKTALLVIQIGQDFDRNLQLGMGAEIELIADGRNSNTAGVASGYVGAIVDGFNTDWRSDHGLAGPPVQVTMRAWYNPSLETRWTMIPSLIGTITLIQTLMFAAMSVAREREIGTFDQLLVTPLRPYEIMIGKALPAMFIGLVQATTILMVAEFWFRIPFQGSLLTLYPGLILFVLAAVGMGLFVSSIASTMQQAMLYAFVLIMPFALLSGLTTPISNMPVAFQYFTLINPLRYAITIAQRVYLEGVGMDRLIPDLWPMALIAVFSLTAATWMFRNKVQ